MGKKILSLCMALALCLGLLPVTALAVDTAPQTLYVGSTTITAGYWTSSDDGTNWTSPQEEPTGDSYIYYDGQGTLKLHNATIQGGSNTVLPPYGAGIYALCSSNQPVALTIELIGTNTITGYYGIYVNAEISADSNGTDASLTITSENNGSLQVSGLYYGIYVYGDRIFEKRGKGRDGTGECGKTRYFQGIERSLGRDRGGGVSFILRLGRRILRPSFLMPSGPRRAHSGGYSAGGPWPRKRTKTPGKPRKTGIPGG